MLSLQYKIEDNYMPIILRETLLDKLLVLKDKNFIKVITGVRRAGKSTLLLQFQELLKKKKFKRFDYFHKYGFTRISLSC